MKTKIEWKNGVNFIANTESGNKISMDGPVDSGGKNNGARPTELLISGMGGCTAFDVISGFIHSHFLDSKQRETMLKKNLSFSYLPPAYSKYHVYLLSI